MFFVWFVLVVWFFLGSQEHFDSLEHENFFCTEHFRIAYFCGKRLSMTTVRNFQNDFPCNLCRSFEYKNFYCILKCSKLNKKSIFKCFKARLDGAVSNLVWWKISLLMAGGLEPDDL